MKTPIQFRVLTAILLWFLTKGTMYAQSTCTLNLNIILSQEWIDSFPIRFPGCTHLDATLNIQGSMIYSLDSLRQLEYIRHVKIINTKVRTLSGLENVTSAHQIEIGRNEELVSVNDLRSLKKVNSLLIFSSPKLLDLQGVQPDSVLSRLSISRNKNLQNLAGLRAKYVYSMFVTNNTMMKNIRMADIDSVYKITIRDTQSMTGISFYQPEFVHLESRVLEDISELNQLTNLQRLNLQYMWNVENCAIPIICRNLDKENFLNLQQNATGCNTIEEIKAACLVSSHETEITEKAPVVRPNPFLEKVEIIIPSDKEAVVWQCRITDVNGKLVHTQASNPNTSSVEIFTVDWPPGVYFYQLHTHQNKIWKGKFVKIQ